MKAFIRSVLPKLGLLVFGLVIALLLVEVLARLTGMKLDAGLEPQGYYNPDPQTGYTISDNFPDFHQSFEGTDITYWSNNVGCFDEPYDATKDDKPLALLVGDSFTWGFTPYDQKWGSTIESVLGQRVLKCGVNGYGTKQEIVHAQQKLDETKAQPKLLIVGYFYNDLAGDYLDPSVVAFDGRLVGKKIISDIETGAVKTYSDEELAERDANFDKYCKTFVPQHPWAMRGVCFLKKHSVLYPYVKESGKKLMTAILGPNFYHGLVVEPNPFEDQTEFLSFVPETTYPWLPQAWKDHLASLDQMNAFAKAHGMQLVVTLIPYKAQVYPSLAADAKAKVPQLDLSYGRTKVTQHLDAQRIKYVDLTDDFAAYAKRHDDAKFGTDHDLYWTYDGHWNPRGNQLAGLLVSKALLGYDAVDLTPEARKSAAAEIDSRLKALE